MIEFQKTVESLNKQIHQAANEIDLFSKVSQNKDYNIKKNRARINLDNSTMHLLSYMSLWDINVLHHLDAVNCKKLFNKCITNK